MYLSEVKNNYELFILINSNFNDIENSKNKSENIKENYINITNLMNSYEKYKEISKIKCRKSSDNLNIGADINLENYIFRNYIWNNEINFEKPAKDKYLFFVRKMNEKNYWILYIMNIYNNREFSKLIFNKNGLILCCGMNYYNFTNNGKKVYRYSYNTHRNTGNRKYTKLNHLFNMYRHDIYKDGKFIIEHYNDNHYKYIGEAR